MKNSTKYVLTLVFGVCTLFVQAQSWKAKLVFSSLDDQYKDTLWIGCDSSANPSQYTVVDSSINDDFAARLYDNKQGCGSLYSTQVKPFDSEVTFKVGLGNNLDEWRAVIQIDTNDFITSGFTIYAVELHAVTAIDDVCYSELFFKERANQYESYKDSLSFYYDYGEWSSLCNKNNDFYDIETTIEIRIRFDQRKQCTLTSLNGVKEQKVDFNLYPNPASSSFTIDHKKAFSGVVKCYTTDGSLVFEEKVLNQATSSFELQEKGVCVIQRSDENSFITQRLVVE